MRAGIRKYVALFCRVFASSPRRVRVNPLAACREPSPPKVSNREHLVFILGLAIYISERILAAKKFGPGVTSENQKEPSMKTNLQNGSSIRFGSGLSTSAEVREQAQHYFFAVIRETCPELLCKLRDDLLPLYAELAPVAPGSFWEMEYQQPALAQAVVSWCGRFHLVGVVEAEPEWHGADWATVARMNSLWPAVRIHETLRAWSGDRGSFWRDAEPPNWPQMTRFRGRTGSPRMLNIPLPDLEDFDSEAQYKRHVSEILRQYMRKDLAQQKGNASSEASMTLKIRPDHFAWLALRQMNHLTSRAIAEWYRKKCGERIQVTAVQMGMKAAADLLTLQLRVGPWGRPKKSTVLCW
jgi:hypothetical protein